tara:strand:- start:999 stop:2549 length:1551 start_codon:yes stop_codon:yes gene_type:complete
MLAAENGAIPGGKVGGVGDVIRDVPKALAKVGHEVTVITPGYQRFSKLLGARLLNTLTIDFCSSLEKISLFQLEGPEKVNGINHLIVENPIFAACGEGMIYCDDQGHPFARDAHKFALFCKAVCHTLITGAIVRPDVIHLHDWHSTLFLLLRKTQPAYKKLNSIPTVYTIHNLSIQGVRPFRQDNSSLEAWFPGLTYLPAEIADPAIDSCVNMMRMGIKLADKVHVVSPTYAKEILRPSNPELGLIRGEGLEKDLRQASRKGKIAGILNGCEYPTVSKKILSRTEFIDLASDCLLDWVGNENYINTAYFFAQQRIMSWSRRKEGDICIVASIGRLTGQKVSLLTKEIEPGFTALEALLKELGSGIYIMLGSGDNYYENFMSRIMSRYDNFIFLKGYSDELAEALYQFCDVFLMPSSYEPCGISQMLAMRAGKPCLVHKVGGLADTVKNNVNGFSFSGKAMPDQLKQMLNTFKRMLKLRCDQPQRWQTICQAAVDSRFTWDKSIKEYEEKLYNIKTV